MNLLDHKILGVLNRTPNSFSDPGLFLNPKLFADQLNSFLKDPRVIVDVGFESTAPMNSAISFEEELLRFRDFLEASKEFSFEGKFISFDTYKVKNFLIMAAEFRKLHPKSFIIFNDVSGVLDTELKEALLKFKDEKFYYIYTFSHIPERSHVLDHMKYLNNNEDIIDQTSAAFINAYKWFSDIGLEDRLILDPGFGFSKNYEQNWRLIDHYDLLEKKIEETHPHLKNFRLIGLSKKSFLKKSLPENFSLSDLENLHLKCIQEIKKKSLNPLLFRMHDPAFLD